MALYLRAVQPREHRKFHFGRGGGGCEGKIGLVMFGKGGKIAIVM